LAALPTSAAPGGDGAVFVNELHYDNAGADTGERVEVAAQAGTDLTGWSIVLYNGANGQPYANLALEGVVGDQTNGWGFVVVDAPGAQNGAPDGLAVVDSSGAVRQFLSYEGAFAATAGPANGLLSTDIGVLETGSEPAGASLQLNGAGDSNGDFSWAALPASSTFGAANTAQTFDVAPPHPPPPPPAPCPPAPSVTPIGQLQGDTDVSPCSGRVVTVEGVVVGDYEGPAPALRGFYVQSRDSEHDANALTSEGVFVFNANNDAVALGDVVSVTGSVVEFQGQTQVSASSVTVLASDAVVTPATIALPWASATAPEAFEGMLATLPQQVTVTEHFLLGRFGEVTVSSGGRLAQPTTVAEPGAAAAAIAAANSLNRLKVDDALQNQNADPIVLGRGGRPSTAANPLRGGDTITGLTGVLTYTWAGNAASPNAYRLRPIGDLSDSGSVPGGGSPAFEASNLRSAAAPDVGGSVQVAGFNVLNYFLTLDVGTQANCGPDGFKVECRGAETATEFTRQRDKLLSALQRLDAEVIGLIELENSTGVDPAADIVAGLNQRAGADVWAAIDTGVIGTDVIKVGLIYRSDRVTPLGEFAVIDSSVDPRFDDTRNRPSLAQSFVDADGEVFTVVNNHLKSKGCGEATGADLDQLDGQSCYNPTRVSAAEALVDWIATQPTGVADDDVLVIGDLNSYAKEDPIDVFIGAGFSDLGAEFGGVSSYSFAFDGQWGSLDYALASPSMREQVTGAAKDHINADEPAVLDYNTNFKSAAQQVSLYATDEFRTSDHDPVLVGLQLDGLNPLVGALPRTLWPPNHTMRTVFVVASQAGRPMSVEILDVTSSEADSGLGPDDVPTDIEITGDRVVSLRAERYSSSGRTYTLRVAVSSGEQTIVTAVAVVVSQSRRR
jgi:predicted extracellular nuclease